MLKEIVEQKTAEVKASKENMPVRNLVFAPSDRDFKQALKEGFNLIAEIKLKSPSAGIIKENTTVEDIAKIYEENSNVKAISVLTDEINFGMNKDSLKKVREVTTKPLLRKEFIIDEYQIYEARAFGADAVLLIARILNKEQIERFLDVANNLNMDCIVEVQSNKELQMVLETSAEIIGINNRDLETLNMDMMKVYDLADKIPKGKIIVTESGYDSASDLSGAKNMCNAALIGTSILKAVDISQKIDELMQ